ncbi:uncharacterized protein LOC131691849 [Topomyia yanbarensis]|uniref:uncharacterized protein LOC131691849 n=1 Tax=Topomyia yanbarensis TaxID=2498891 RepID=UPI00273B6781|nr:uncharacterized protein LOC131691849 [Topomyia yanbarensis]
MKSANFCDRITMIFKVDNIPGANGLRLTLLVAVIVAVLVARSNAAQAANNNNETPQQIDGKIVNQGSEQKRSGLLDNIFNIPIQTLKAVNELVQSIAGNLQAAGSGTYFGSKNRNINVNLDDDESKKEKN